MYEFLVLSLCVTTITWGFPNKKSLIDLTHYGSDLLGQPNEETGKVVSQWSVDSAVNPEELGEYLEGDLLVPSVSRNGLLAFSAKWDGAIVPYVITGPYGEKDLEIIHNAMKQYHDNTCIRFRRKQPDDVDYINIANAKTGCWSSVGKIGGPQTVNLQTPGCLSTIGTPIHELMHALGFHHEQARYERDNYVDILWYNVRKGHDVNFAKVSKNTTGGFGVTYDYGSVMHYSANAFSVNNHPTIIPKDRNARIGQREGFSVGDITKIRNMYNCTPTPMAVKLVQNQDYQSQWASGTGQFVNNLLG